MLFAQSNAAPSLVCEVQLRGLLGTTLRVDTTHSFRVGAGARTVWTAMLRTRAAARLHAEHAVLSASCLRWGPVMVRDGHCGTISPTIGRKFPVSVASTE